MSNIKSFEMEDIAYKEWSDHLDLVATSRASPWLPAYGYHPPSPLQEIFQAQNDPFLSEGSSLLGQQQYLFLETIIEETSDDLCSESDKSGPTGWNSDSDADSVIHVPKMPETQSEWRNSDLEVEIPKKRRRRIFEKTSLSDDDEPHENAESTSLSSRSSSLIAFESLEKHCEDVFRTTASNDPFGHELGREGRRNGSRDGSEENVSDEETSSSDDTLHRSLSSHGSFRSSLTNDSRIRSYRSFDSLNLLENSSPLNYSVGELSQSHNALDYEKEKEREQEFVVRDKKLTATTADLSTVTDTYESDLFSMKNSTFSFRKRPETASFHYRDVRSNKKSCDMYSSEDGKKDEKNNFRGRKSYSAEGLKSQLPIVEEDGNDLVEGKHGKSEPCLSVPSKTQHSVENLSEDSGFGDHISGKNKASVIDFRNSVSSIPEDEDSSPPESSSSYYSDCSGSEEGSIVSSEGRERNKCVNKKEDHLKITKVKEPEVRGCLTVKNDVEVKFNSSQSQTRVYGWDAEGEADNLIATSVTFASPVSDEPFSADYFDDVRPKPEFKTFFKNHCNKSYDDLKSDNYFGGKLSVFKERNEFFYEACDEMNNDVTEGQRDIGRQMASRLPVVSTPNLFTNDEDFVRNVPSAASSLTHVPLKTLDDDDDDENMRNKLMDLRKGSLGNRLPGSQSGKGVHFCPVVSEVSWRDSYSEDEDTSDESSDPSTDEMSNRSLEDLCMDDEDEEFSETERNLVAVSNGDGKSQESEGSSQDSDNSVPRRSGKDINLKNINNLSNGNKPHVENKPVPPTTTVTPTSLGHVFYSYAAQPNAERITKLSVSETTLTKEVYVDDARRDSDYSSSSCTSMASSNKKQSKNRFGGFFERFSFRRLSNRIASNGGSKKQKKDEKKEKSVSVGVIARSAGNQEEDVRIIPLHGPEDEVVEERTKTVSTPSVLSSKPPLPPNPPRLSGNSRKRSPLPGIVSGGLQDGDANGNSNMPGVRGNISRDIDCTNNVINRPIANVEPSYKTYEKPTGLLETDLDADVTIQSAVRRPLAQANVGNNKKARSLMNLGLGDMSVHQNQHRNSPSNLLQPSPHRSHGSVAVDDRAKSMEFLLDKENQAAVLPPENELQKVGGGDRVLSEHQLRVQRSLQKLNIPDWYKNSAVAQTPQGFILKRHSDAGHHGWPGLGSKTTSLSSLGSTQSASARSPTSHVLSPSPTPHLFTRWSTSRLNSGGTSSSTSPCGSARSSFNYRQPYLGWRSQERLTRPRTPAERLAAGLLPQQKQHLQIHNQSQISATPNLSEVRTSIKEVTSAIVHSFGADENGSRETLRSYYAGASPSPSPKWGPTPKGSTGKLCWLESSFVGSRPLDQPETPLTLTETAPVKTEVRTNELYLDLKPPTENNHYNVNQINEVMSEDDRRFEKAFEIRTKPSPGSTTLDDVLESLLGLPPTSRSPSPGPLSMASGAASSPGRCRPALALPERHHQRHSCGDIRANVSGSASDAGKDAFGKETATVRRKSEGHNDFDANDRRSRSSMEGNKNDVEGNGRKEFQPPQPIYTEAVVKCRYSKCGKTATVFEAKRTFKTCHNCSHVYCSRECRRAHWERHRRTCLHSRVGALCRQVLATAKEDVETLHQLSLLARRGYLTHGRGAVKTFFSSPELAERFVSRGFGEMSEPAYVRWSDLLPTEMGADLYAELMKLCKSYNPDTRFVLYVAVCVVSEVPTTGAVKWERQLVSRCCKIRLDKSLVPPKNEKGNPPPLPPRRSSSEFANITRDMENPETLILTSLPGIAGQIPEQKVREIGFTNIQRELRQRGVSLRRQFPDIYKKLCSYVEGTAERFTPVTIYPRDSVSGKTFMCIIMPDSEPEKLQLVPKDSTRVQTIDISIEQKSA